MGRKKKKIVSPLLDEILHGAPAVALNTGHYADSDGVKGLFNTRLLNGVVIFKYPYFEEDFGEALVLSEEPLDMDLYRPMETGIYVPRSMKEMEEGGYGVYVRQTSYRPLMKQLLGLEEQSEDPAVVRDLGILKVIDSIPTLDRFILVNALEKHGFKEEARKLRYDDWERQRWKVMTAEQMMPFLTKAFSITQVLSKKDRAKWFSMALWDDNREISRMIIETFRLNRGEVLRVLDFWKGVAFYLARFEEIKTQTSTVLRWFQSDMSTPHDIRQNHMYAQQLEMHKTKIYRKYKTLLGNMQNIVHRYDAAATAYVDHDDDGPLKEFLVAVNQVYWIFGYGCTVMEHTAFLYDRAKREAERDRLSFEETTRLFSLFDSALSSRIETTSTIG